jgi:RNA polymerase sigma-70 factor (ECF subfamily)
MTKNKWPGAEQASKDFIAAIKSGDERAFSAFYMGYADSLVHFLTRITGNSDDAKEVTQEAFATLWEKREALEPHTSLYGFVYGMARNMAFRMLRTKKAESKKADERSYDVNEFAGLADEGLISDETSLLLEEVIRNMPEQRRRVFELSRKEGLSYNEIAKEMGISLNTVRTHMTFALKELRAALANVILWYFITQ